MTPLLAGLALGAAGSLHCAAMCGPLVGVMAPVFGRRWSAVLWYNAGRLFSYVLIGVAAGLLGATAHAAGAGRGLSIVAGALMVLTALGQVARPRRLLGAWWTQRLSGVMARLGHVRASRPHFSAALAGSLNGALPCGLVYTAALAAATAREPLQGAAVMVMFGLGTAPAMMAVWLSTASVPSALRVRLRALAPVAVGLVGLLLIVRGVADSAKAQHAGHGLAHPTETRNH